MGCAKTENEKNKIKEVSYDSSQQTENIDLAGTFYTVDGETATINSIDKDTWEIAYTTSKGNIKVNFETKWIQSGKMYTSRSAMNQYRIYSGLDVKVEYKNNGDIKVVMLNSDDSNEKVYTKQNPKVDEKYSAVLNGDLSAFVGQLADETVSDMIAASGFTYGGYTPDDYYNNQVTAFPTITKEGYWSGITSRGNFEIKKSDLPKQINDYYEVHIYGTNVESNYDVLTLYLVPPTVIGPDGETSNDRRVFQKFDDETLQMLMYLQTDWWKKYQSPILSNPWSPAKTEQLKSMMASWEETMGQSYETFSLDTEQLLDGAPAGLFYFWNISLDGEIVEVTKSITGNEGAVNIVAYYCEKRPIRYDNPIRYLFVIKDGVANVYVSLQSQGNAENIYWWETTKNTDLKNRFIQLVNSN